MSMESSNRATAFNRFTSLLILAVMAVTSVLSTSGNALAQYPEQETYESPDAAVAAFTAALHADALEPLSKVLGQAILSFSSGDDVQDKDEIQKIDKAAKENVRPVMINPKRIVLYLGALNWPFPIPIVQGGTGRWYFDTIAGREEYLNRRIGRNELAAIETLHAFTEAQIEYASEDRDGDGVVEYAMKIVSSPGAKDGLYWTVGEGEARSPIGEFVAVVRDEGYGPNAESYKGYRFGLFTEQGPAAVGGAKEYIVDGNLVRGFAFVAWPVNWGSSGIMTFIIGPDGHVFEKNLGPKTSELVLALDAFNPDSTWRPAVP